MSRPEISVRWCARHQKREAIRRRDHLGEPVHEIARSYNVSHSTISRLTPDPSR
jgi:IS30 family transposase